MGIPTQQAFSTADLCDAHGDAVQVAEPVFRSFGARSAFSGAISTVRCFEDNSRVREALETDGGGRVLVVDGQGSLRCALMGDRLAALAGDNRWAGAVIFGCIRDSTAIDAAAFGVKALATHPRASVKLGSGECDITVRFAGVTCAPGDYLYADDDGIVVATRALLE